MGELTDHHSPSNPLSAEEASIGSDCADEYLVQKDSRDMVSGSMHVGKRFN